LIRVVGGLEMLRKHGVEFNTLTVVNRANSQKPLETYRFLRDIGSGFIQFIPLVERAALAPTIQTNDGLIQLSLATPPLLSGGQGREPRSPVTGLERARRRLRQLPRDHLRRMGPARRGPRVRPTL
jgi:hypothetical protein